MLTDDMNAHRGFIDWCESTSKRKNLDFFGITDAYLSCCVSKVVVCSGLFGRIKLTLPERVRR